MKIKTKLLLIIAVSILFSCRNSKELIYLNDAANNEMLKGITQEYIIKSGDILYVSIKSMNPEVNTLFNPESNMEVGGGSYGYQKYSTPSSAYLYGFEIDPDGNLKLPMLGKINLLGTPISKVEGIVQKKADEFLNDAIVKVKLLNYKVTVTGEVRSPGTFYNYNNSITVIEAIALANGNTDFASIKNVMVVRSFPEGNKAYSLDLSSKKIYLSEAFYLQPNDYVIVQPDKYKNFQLNSQAYSLMFSSISILLAVLGFVLK
ncbi:MAG: polysaccharide biosynthesis/export family protein [Prolixibacteraceae bacterium]|nr:polysaccharide biosynthesis/export family protein [Prolixibacteraceae bacterium]